MNEQELQQQFFMYLGYQVAQSMPQDQLQQEYAKFVQQIQLGQGALYAKQGAKLDYVRYLRGECPTGYEMQYFKSGGRLCKKCVKRQNGGNVKTRGPISVGQQAIDEFKCGAKMKKHLMGGVTEEGISHMKSVVGAHKKPNGKKCNIVSPKERNIWEWSGGSKQKNDKLGANPNTVGVKLFQAGGDTGGNNTGDDRSAQINAARNNIYRAEWNRPNGVYSYGRYRENNGNENTFLYTNNGDLYWRDRNLQIPNMYETETYDAGKSPRIGQANAARESEQVITNYERSLRPAWLPIYR